MEIDSWRNQLWYPTKTFVRSLALHQWRRFVFGRQLCIVWLMGQNFAPLGFGRRKDHSPFQGPYKGELNAFPKHTHKVVADLKWKVKRVSHSNCIMVKHLQSRKKKKEKRAHKWSSKGLHSIIPIGFEAFDWATYEECHLVCKSHLFGVAEENTSIFICMASTDMWSACGASIAIYRCILRKFSCKWVNFLEIPRG